MRSNGIIIDPHTAQGKVVHAPARWHTHTQPIHPHPGSSWPTKGLFLAHDQRLSQDRPREHGPCVGSGDVLLLQLVNNEYCASGTYTRHKGELHLIDVQHLVDGGIEHPFPQLHDYLWAWDHDSYHGQGLHPCPYRGYRSSPPIYWDHTISENSLRQFSYQLNSFLISRFQHLGYDASKAGSLVAFHLAECFVDLGCRHTGRRVSKCKCVCVGVCVCCVVLCCVCVGGGYLRWLIVSPFKLNIEDPSRVFLPSLHLVFVSERQQRCVHSSHQ